MSSVLEIIKTRRSVRKYKTEPVSRALIEKVIEAGTYAATGRGSNHLSSLQLLIKIFVKRSQN